MRARLARSIELAKQLVRAAARRAVPVDATALSRATPVSGRFGTERGQPIDRHYIESFLRAQAGLIRGRVLEIGGSRYVRQFGTDVTRIDVLHATNELPEATIVGDLTAPETLPRGQIDCFVCTQTLGFIFDVPRAIDGIYHLLRPGGVALATVAGISQISRYDMDRWGDYWRFTDASVRRLFDGRFDVDVTTYGNVAAAIAFLQGLCVEDLPDPQVLAARDPDYQLTIAVVARKRAT